MSFDGKGVPVIKRELTDLKARLGKGEKRQKKKEALVGTSYTVDKKDRSAEDVAKNLIYPDKNQNSHEQNKVKAQNIRRLASLERKKADVVDEIIRDAQVRDPEYRRQFRVKASVTRRPPHSPVLEEFHSYGSSVYKRTRLYRSAHV